MPALGLAERTVRNGWQPAGRHCRAFHARLVEETPLDLGQVQADEIQAKTQQGPLWVALALMVSTRLWLGGAVSADRDTALLQKMAQQVRSMALCRPLLIAVDGLHLPDCFSGCLPHGGSTLSRSDGAYDLGAVTQLRSHGKI